MSTVLRRIGHRHWSAITEIARQEGREPRNVLDLVIDRGLAARTLGNWPTNVTQYHSGGKDERSKRNTPST